MKRCKAQLATDMSSPTFHEISGNLKKLPSKVLEYNLICQQHQGNCGSVQSVCLTAKTAGMQCLVPFFYALSPQRTSEHTANNHTDTYLTPSFFLTLMKFAPRISGLRCLLFEDILGPDPHSKKELFSKFCLFSSARENVVSWD